MTECKHRKLASIPHDLYFCDMYSQDVYCHELNCKLLGNVWRPYHEIYLEMIQGVRAAGKQMELEL